MIRLKELLDKCRKDIEVNTALNESRWLKTGAAIYFDNQHTTQRKKAQSHIDHARSELSKATSHASIVPVRGSDSVSEASKQSQQLTKALIRIDDRVTAIALALTHLADAQRAQCDMSGSLAALGVVNGVLAQNTSDKLNYSKSTR